MPNRTDASFNKNVRKYLKLLQEGGSSSLSLPLTVLLSSLLSWLLPQCGKFTCLCRLIYGCVLNISSQLEVNPKSAHFDRLNPQYISCVLIGNLSRKVICLYCSLDVLYICFLYGRTTLYVCGMQWTRQHHRTEDL